MQIIAEGIRSIFLWLSIFIYELISNLYDIFERLCKSRILDSEILNSLSQRIGMLLGIVMLFVVSFSVIQMVLEPEKLTDKEKGIGNIAKKIIIVIVMLGTSTAAFNMLYSVQTTIIDSHIISKFLLPNYEMNLDNFGGVLSSELFVTFFKPINPEDSEYKKHMENLRSDIINYNDFSVASEIVNKGVGTFLFWSWGTFHIDFNWLLSPLLGLGALYFLFTYCITVGTRTLQLAFLEIISPMAIISYLSPKKETMFEKWWKVYFATYLDVFIRIAIINLAVFLIAALLDNNMSFTFWNSVGQENNGSDTWVKIFMILAILTFAKKAPDLLKDLFPAGASKLGLGVSSPKKLFDGMLGGNILNKGYQTATKAIGQMPMLGAKKLISGIDSARHGKGFWNGTKRHQGQFGQWLNKQRETLMPEGYKAYKEKREGLENVNAIDSKFNRGSRLLEKILGTGKYGKREQINAWDKMLDGKTEDNYKLLFENEVFIKSKMNVDQASKKEEELRYIQQALSGGSKETFTYDGKSYNLSNANELAKDLDSATKALSGLKEVHTEVSKQYQKDARTEQDYKFIKNNRVNPADKDQTVDKIESKYPDKPKP